MVLGRNPVVECLRADVPATALYIAQGTSNDDRLTEAINTAKAAGLPIQEVSRKELDRLSENGMHQGIALEIPPYKYADPSELIDIARQKGKPPSLSFSTTLPTPAIWARQCAPPPLLGDTALLSQNAAVPP